VFDKKYILTLAEKMIEVVLTAWEKLGLVKLGIGTGRANFNINRRSPTPEGIVFFRIPKVRMIMKWG
jgi:hypothetical protein